MKTRLEKCEAIVAEINAELSGRGSIDLAFVALVMAGKCENVSHPIVQRIQSAIKSHGIKNPSIQSRPVAG